MIVSEYSFGFWIKRRRKALDLTQHDLAQRVRCSPSLIFKIESDERRPSRQIAELLADHLEIPTEQRALFLKIARQEKGMASLDAIPPISELEATSPPELRRQSNLPVSPTSLIGRENEINMIAKQLLDPSCRLLTLTGPGGVGKTRLAVEVARELEKQFSDGVFFIPMAGVSLPESIIPSIADGLGLAFSGPADPKIQVINYLRPKETLFVLDNIEHLLQGGSLLAEILQQTPHVKMLLTSREPVHLQFEWIFEVQGLPIPEDVNSGMLETNSAVALFLQRARQVSRKFSLDTEDHSALVRICQLVDGLPLAIELAASWVRIMSVREIALELERSLDLLETTLHDVPARHRSIRSVFEHSWNLLIDEERAALMKLSVFPEGFTRESAEVIAGTTLMLLLSLVSKSLLRYSKETDRYDLHELIRQYCLAQLHEHPAEEAQTLEMHSQYYSGWLADLEVPLKSARQIETSMRIRSETPNWTSAWRCAVLHQRLDLLRRMLPCLAWYYEIHGYNAEALSYSQFAVSELTANGAPDSFSTAQDKSTFAFLVDQLAWFEFRTGNLEQAETLFAESLALANKFPDPEVLYYIYGNWGYLTLLKGDANKAKQLTMESLMHAQTLQSQWHIAIPVSVLGIVDYQLGNINESYQQLTNSLQMWREVGDPRGLIFCMLYLGSTALTLGKVDIAKSILWESDAIARDKMDRWAQSFALDVLGQVFMYEGQNREARDRLQQSLALAQEIGDQWGSTKTLIHLGEVQAALEVYEDAKRLFLHAYANASQAKWMPTILEVLVAFLFIDGETPPDEKLAALLSVLMQSATPPRLRSKAEGLRDELIAALETEQVELAKALAAEKSPEAWAQDILK